MPVNLVKTKVRMHLKTVRSRTPYNYRGGCHTLEQVHVYKALAVGATERPETIELNAAICKIADKLGLLTIIHY